MCEKTVGIKSNLEFGNVFNVHFVQLLTCACVSVYFYREIEDQVVIKEFLGLEVTR